MSSQPCAAARFSVSPTAGRGCRHRPSARSQLRARHSVNLRALARRFDLSRATLRGWWGRFRARSPTLLAEVLELAISLDPAPVELLTDGEAVVFEALDQAVSRARVRFGERVGDVWRFWSRISGGRVLATNTSASWR